jgi:hypothetical protein
MEGQIKRERSWKNGSVRVVARVARSRNDESLAQLQDIVTRAIKGLVVVILSLMLFSA